MHGSVDICVATFKRPHLLALLLDSLTRQSALAFTDCRIIVADNDAKRSAEQLVAAFRTSSGMNVVYDVAPVQGISHARNLAMQHAVAHFVAFIDDDEEAPPSWLASLLRAVDQHDADVVFGPVIAVLPESAPTWARVHPAFRRPRPKTGSELAFGATGNVLLRRHVLQGLDHWFDPAYARTGGEDTEFFSRVHANGSRLVWCDDAEVNEAVPSERLTIRWVCKRAYRGGQTYFRIFVLRRPWWARFTWLLQRAVASLLSLVLLPIWWLRHDGSFARRLSQLCGWVGQLSQIFENRFMYEEYRAK